MRSSKTGRKTSSVASAVWYVAPSCWNQMLPISSSSIFVNKNSFKTISLLTVTASPCPFSMKNDTMDQNPHQTVTRFGCVGFSKYACEIPVPQMRQFCLFTYPPRTQSFIWKYDFFFAKIVKNNVTIFFSFVQAYTQPDSFGGRIKLIIYQIRYKLSVAIEEISTSWKKTLDVGSYI